MNTNQSCTTSCEYRTHDCVSSTKILNKRICYAWKSNKCCTAWVSACSTRGRMQNYNSSNPTYIGHKPMQCGLLACRQTYSIYILLQQHMVHFGHCPKSIRPQQLFHYAALTAVQSMPITRSRSQWEWNWELKLAIRN